MQTRLQMTLADASLEADSRAEAMQWATSDEGETTLPAPTRSDTASEGASLIRKPEATADVQAECHADGRRRHARAGLTTVDGFESEEVPDPIDTSDCRQRRKTL